MDDFGNALHWTDDVRGWHSLGLYGWASGLSNMCVLYQGVDFSELDHD